jgi:protein-disulfide isomerase
MENRELNDNRWVEERMGRLEPSSDWRPDPERGLVLVRERRRIAGFRRRVGMWSAAAGTVIITGLLFSPACEAAGCTTPARNLGERIWLSMFSGEKEGKPAPAQAAAAYKVTGSPTAPITCELYTDYQCPACAKLYLDVVPMLLTDYVRTGKIRLVHRDFPLPLHAFSRSAARYANAAGRAGFYDLAVNRIFETQNVWSRDGDVAVSLAEVLTPGAMEQVRRLIRDDASIDETIDADLDMGHRDHIGQTPSLVVVASGKRQVISPIGDYALLKSYLDALLH